MQKISTVLKGLALPEKPEDLIGRKIKLFTRGVGFKVPNLRPGTGGGCSSRPFTFYSQIIGVSEYYSEFYHDARGTVRPTNMDLEIHFPEATISLAKWLEEPAAKITFSSFILRGNDLKEYSFANIKNGEIYGRFLNAKIQITGHEVMNFDESALFKLI